MQIGLRRLEPDVTKVAFAEPNNWQAVSDTLTSATGDRANTNNKSFPLYGADTEGLSTISELSRAA